MSLVEFNWSPSTRQIRQFAAICMAALPLVGWVWGASANVVLVLAAIGASMAALSVPFPGVIRPIFLGLMIVTTPIGMVLGEVAMLLIYFGVLLPIGLIFRVIKRDALQLRRPNRVSTYWSAVRTPPDVSSYYRQS